jgi:uncharacterized membrane protein YphA (DoxX/SURF4 family)
MNLQLGRNIYGLAAIVYGVITLFWHQINSLGNISNPEILVFIIGVVEIIGGLTLQWQKTLRIGALTLIAVHFIFLFYLVPFIYEMPLDYSNWGNFFQEFSIVLGSLIVFVSNIQSDTEKRIKISRAAYTCYGICVFSYSLYQLFYLSYTAGLVPKWIPPGQMFWAVTTSVAFALAAVAILSGRSALLASRLLTSMFICFCLLVWLPASIINPYDLSNWYGNADTLAVAGSAWIVADLLSQQKIILLQLPFGRIRTERKEV